jgi:hypothetical protein
MWRLAAAGATCTAADVSNDVRIAVPTGATRAVRNTARL